MLLNPLTVIIVSVAIVSKGWLRLFLAIRIHIGRLYD